MKMKMDKNVKMVAEFMQTHIPASKLVGVASSMQIIAEIMWGRFRQEAVIALKLESDPICVCVSPPVAKGSLLDSENVGGDSVVEVADL